MPRWRDAEMPKGRDELDGWRNRGLEGWMKGHIEMLGWGGRFWNQMSEVRGPRSEDGKTGVGGRGSGIRR
jgi:hypothetical protein